MGGKVHIYDFYYLGTIAIEIKKMYGKLPGKIIVTKIFILSYPHLCVISTQTTTTLVRTKTIVCDDDMRDSLQDLGP